MPDDIHTEFATSTVVNALDQTRDDERLELLQLLGSDVTQQPTTTDLIRRSDRTVAFRTAALFVIQKRRLADAGHVAMAERSLAAVRSELERLSPMRLESKRQPATSGVSALPPNPPASFLPELSDGRFIQVGHETLLGRGCHPKELRSWQIRLECGSDTRQSLLVNLFATSLLEAAADRANEAAHDPSVLHVMGTGERVTLADWQARAELVRETASEAPKPCSRFDLKSPPRLAVTAIASLYRGGRHIRRFMESITRQTCFRDYAELIIIDANSPDREHEVIEPYLARYTNIRYIRVNHRIGIYDAWNRAIEEARGEYLTCTNVDDLRRKDSLELQAATLDALPFVDVVYQDFYCSFDAELTFDQVARYGYRSRLPLVTRNSLLNFNPPHNAPMWRRRLHDQLGLFDTRYQSAGDYDFWMRCVGAGTTFYKLNDPHVAYYQNPEGISTRIGTRGFAETKAVHRCRDRELVSELLVMPFVQFCREHLQLLPEQPDDGAQDRARLCELALRHCAREMKYGARTERAAA